MAQDSNTLNSKCKYWVVVCNVELRPIGCRCMTILEMLQSTHKVSVLSVTHPLFYCAWQPLMFQRLPEMGGERSHTDIPAQSAARRTGSPCGQLSLPELCGTLQAGAFPALHTGPPPVALLAGRGTCGQTCTLLNQSCTKQKQGQNGAMGVKTGDSPFQFSLKKRRKKSQNTINVQQCIFLCTHSRSVREVKCSWCIHWIPLN